MYKKGFSMIEIIIATSIMSIVLLVGIQATVVSLQTMAVEEHKIYATNFAEEIIDLVNIDREANWTNFRARALPGPTGRIYCLNQNIQLSSLAALYSTSTCSGVGIVRVAGEPPASIPQIYTRTMTLTSVGPQSTATRVHVLVTVAWSDFGKNYSVPIRTSFSIHE